MKSRLLCNSSKYYTFLCRRVCVYECIRVRAWARPRVSVGAQALRRACACVALLIQHATRMRHTVRGLSGSTIICRLYLISGTIFEKKKKVT
jgi:hypothetical protein